MFESSLSGPQALAGADDAALIAAITGWAKVEAAAAARRLAVIAELVARRAYGPTDRGRWSCDNWDAMAAEVAAAQHVSHGMASGQAYLAVALRDRLPQVGALFLDGAISARLAATMAWHTTLIDDTATLIKVDGELADMAAGLGPLSVAKTATAIETLIDRHDPAALRRIRGQARSRNVVVDTTHTESGTTAIWGRLYATDAAALDERLGRLSRSVCDDDPRTLAQRRADAMGALAAGTDALYCGCGQPDCPAADAATRTHNVVIHVVAEAAALTAQPDPHMSGEHPARPISPGMTLTEKLAPDPEPDPPTVTSPATIVGGGSIPAPLIAELINRGAAVKPLHLPADTCPEPGYRPSAALDAFIRCRDLTCRFPGCDRPATHCDIDHAIPYPYGPTHPSNLRCLCRKHHLLKTFWTGPTGWTDKQHPDGTIVWRSPTGQTYLTRPGSRLLFPSLCLDTGSLDLPATPRPPDNRGIKMPLRKRTRAQDRNGRIKAERALNAAHAATRIAARRADSHSAPTAGPTPDPDDPPPF